LSIEAASSPQTGVPARKFLFERSFDGDLGLDLDEKAKPTFTEEQLDTAKKEAFEEGRRAGEQSAMAAEAQVQTNMLATLGDRFSAALAEAEACWNRQLADLMSVATVIARKIVPVYAEKNGTSEIEAIVARAVEEMGREPRLVVRVPEASFDFLNDRIAKIAEERAFPGKIVVLGPSDCKVEWADGGIERDFNRLWQEIDGIMEGATAAPADNMAALTSSAPAESATSAPEEESAVPSLNAVTDESGETA
jgi:flagellar assembly protein FliH